MPIVDSKAGTHGKTAGLGELVQAANMMRGYDLVALCAAGSGHAGGTMSIMDITAALYLQVARHDPQNPNWPERDRIIWSTGHKAPSLYLGLAMAGYCALGLGKVDLVGILDLMDGRKLEGMMMVELDSGGQMPYTPREATQIAHDWLVKNGVTMKA